eukprot:scaffold1534_cov391-Prasinococcus_capsulatus_cf.AAC.6
MGGGARAPARDGGGRIVGAASRARALAIVVVRVQERPVRAASCGDGAPPPCPPLEPSSRRCSGARDVGCRCASISRANPLSIGSWLCRGQHRPTR